MNYTEMLNQLIDKSGKMLKEIAEECQRDGVSLTNTYLSSLKTTPGKIASDEISRAIAKACNAKYTEVLVVQAYLDKAPEIILEYLDAQRKCMRLAEGFFTEDFTNQPDAMEFIMSMRESSLAEYICETIVHFRDSESVSLFENALNDFKAKQDEPKCMVIYPEQIKEIKFVNESDIRKLQQE